MFISTSIKKIFYSSGIILSLNLSPATFAQENSTPDFAKLRSELANLQSSIAELSSIVKAQQIEIQQLKSKSIPSQTMATTTKEEILVEKQETKSIKTAGSTPYLPEIGVIADIVGTSTQSQEDEEGNDRLAVREVEFVFSHDVDPYSTLNVVATFSDFEDPALEEANLTYFGLPADIKAKIGRMRPRIGKASASHRDALDTVDEPLVIQKYFGIEGLYKTGLELSAFTPFSSDTYTQELIAGVMEGGTGEDGDLFDQTTRYPVLYSHLANFLEISDSSSFELGGTFLTGAEDPDSKLGVKAFGIDATYLHNFNAVNKLKLQSETYLQNRDGGLVNLEDESTVYSKSSPYGFYTLADYKFAERWNTGLRYDYVQPSNESEDIPSYERAYSGYLTFHQSEFARWRLQYQRADIAGEDDDNRFFLQGTFAIGTHKHQLN